MRLAWLAPLVFALGCYRIDARVSGLAASAGDHAFPAAGPLAGRMVEAEQTFTLTPDEGAFVGDLLAAHVDAVRLVPRAGVASLDFLRTVTLVWKGADGAPDTTLVAADALVAAPDGSVRLPVDVDVDPARLGAPMSLDATLAYVAPADGWTLGVEALLAVRTAADVKAY